MNRDHVIQQLLYSDFIGNNIINSPCNKLYKRDKLLRVISDLQIDAEVKIGCLLFSYMNSWAILMH